MAKEKKALGPSVTYHDLGGDAPVVEIAGVVFEDGEAVDLVEELGEQKAGPILEKLAGNHFFDVEGSNARHDDVRDQIVSQSTTQRRKPAKAGKVKPSVAKRIAKEDADDDKVGGDKQPKPEDENDEPELPADVPTPDAPTLENNTRPRLARARR